MKNCIIVSTGLDGVLRFWVGGFDFSVEYPDARALTTANAKEIARECAKEFPGVGIEIIRNYGLENSTGVMF